MSDLSSTLYEDMIGDFKQKSRNAHLVQFFQNDGQLIKSIAEYSYEGFKKGEAVILIATDSHLTGIEKSLIYMGIDVAQKKELKQMITLEAHQTLSSLMVRRSASRRLFQQKVGPLMTETTQRYPAIRAYGEMVDILTLSGNFEAAMSLESYWNELALTYSFSLLCGYTADHFKNNTDGVEASMVCGCHSHTIAGEIVVSKPIDSLTR